MNDARGVRLSPGDQKRLNNGKKRRLNIPQWSDKLRKMNRDAGSPYISKRKKPVPGKLPPTEGRVCSCQFKCGHIDHEEALHQFVRFYKLDYNHQTAFLVNSCIKLMDISRRRVSEDISKRHCSFQYYLPISEDDDFRICQKTLCHIFKITPRRIQMIQEKLKFDKPLDDQRGNHDNRWNKTKDETRDLIKDHISSFPKQESHYSRHESKKQCLNPDLSLKKMWQLYCSRYPNSKVSLHLYRDVFNSDFKLRFGLPRSDTCKKCDQFYIQMASTKHERELNRIENESKLHHMRADLAYKTLAGDSVRAKGNISDYVVVCIDLQQVLFCPTLTHGDVFYQRQLSCYNIAIHNMGTNKAMMFFWNETVAKRGSADIVSCLLKFVSIHFSKLEEGETRTLVIWSDRCVGQNNNWRMVALMQHLVLNNFFSSVEQKFLATGHSFLPCDRDFAVIEMAKKGKMVYVPKQWVEVIANAKSTNPFDVCMMETDDFKNIDIVLNSLQTNKFSITSHIWYQISGDDPTTLRGRTSHNVMQPWQTHCLAKTTPGRKKQKLPPVKVGAFPNQYEGPLPIKAAKKKDLMAMSKFLPQEYVSFYEKLKVE